MISKSIIGATCACLMVVSFNVSAAIITHGSLSTNDDGSSNITSDTLNKFEWLRLDVLAPLSYAETLGALGTQDGGGWNIAGLTQAIMFADALLSNTGNLCTDSVSACGSVVDWTDGDLGANFDTSANYAWYLTNAGRAGYVTVDAISGEVILRGWSSLAASDTYATGGFYESLPVSWLLYRETAVIPVPTAIWLFASGLVGLVCVARRKV